jgi:hypothetical protein
MEKKNKRKRREREGGRKQTRDKDFVTFLEETHDMFLVHFIFFL